MDRSHRNPDAYDAIREDALTEQKPVAASYYARITDACHAEACAVAGDIAAEADARIVELEAQLAAATERERKLRNDWADAIHDHNQTILKLRDAQHSITDAHAAITRQLAEPERADTGEMIAIATILAAALAAQQKEETR